MATWHGLALAGALLALLCLSCAVALLARADRAAMRRGDRAAVRRGDRAAVRRGDRAAMRRGWRRRDPGTLERLRRLNEQGPVELALLSRPGPEQIAGELRRLQRMRHHGPATRSEVWLAAVNDSYDRWLCEGCQTLGVGEELRRLDGLDRELERARIEDLLRAKGF